MDGDFENLVAEKKLNSVKGIGKGLQSVIYEYYEKGESSLYNELVKIVPPGIGDLMKIRGLGPKKIKILYNELGIQNIGELEYAIKENRLALLKGFGISTQQKIEAELEKIKIFSKYVLLSAATRFCDELIPLLLDFQSVEKVEISGEIRRGMEIISSIDVILLVDNQTKFLDEIKNTLNYKLKSNVIELDEYYNIPVNLHLTENEKEFTVEQFLTTGSKKFLEKIDALKEIIGENEAKIFEHLKFPYVIPEMRENEYFGARDKLNENSRLTLEDFKGLLHFHSTFSDGRDELKNMLKSAEERGFKYAAVCDHSKAAFYANGLDESGILLQKEELSKLSSQFRLHLFQGIESDILQNGDLDYEENILKQFDFVVASIHSRFSMNEEEMTKRILKAVENPYTDLLAHPSGRLLLSRDPYKFDVKKIIDACAANNVAIEINASPRRLDLDWRRIYYAREKGCLFSINPDAHSTEEIDYLKYGILSGRKGGLQPEEVINCYELNKFKKFLTRKVNRNI